MMIRSAFAMGLLICSCANKKQVRTTSPSQGELTDVNGDNESENNNQIAFVAESINSMSGDIRECYAKATAVDKNITGRIVLMASIGQAGQATIEVADDEIKNESLNSCVMTPWQQKKWPASFKDGDVIQLPPLSFVAAEEQYVVSGHYLDFLKSDTENVAAKTLLSKLNTGNNEDFELELVKVDAKKKLRNHANGTMFFFVLDGEGQMTLQAKDPQEARPGSVFVMNAGFIVAEPKLGSALNVLAFWSPKISKKTNMAVSQIQSVLVDVWNETKPSDLSGSKKDTTRASGFPLEIGVFVSSANETSNKLDTENGTHIYYLTQGTAKFKIDGVDWSAQVGEAVQIPAGKTYSLAVGRSGLKSVFFNTGIKE